MKKIFFTALFLISSLSLYSENCYKPAGHIACLLDLNSEKGQEIVKKVENEKRKIYMDSMKYFEKGRFGNEKVGFIEYPKTEGWTLFADVRLPVYAMQISKGNGDIYTLMSYDLAKEYKNMNSEKAVEKMLKNVYDKYKKAGVSENKMSLEPVILNGHKGMQFVLTEFQGKSMIKNGVIVKDKLYEITVEGLPKDVIEMQKVVEKSCNEIK